MTKSKHLSLPEEVMLLSLRDKLGTIEHGAWYLQAVSGAVIAEGMLAGRLRTSDQGPAATISYEAGPPVGDELVDEWLDKIRAESKPRKVSYWTGRIPGTKDLKTRVARSLVRRGILRVAEDKLLMIFNRTIYPEVDPAPERELRERMREAILGNSPEVSPRTAALVSLAKGTGLLNLVLSKAELAERKQRLEQLIDGQVAGKASHDLVVATSSVILTTCIMPVILH